ncbi:MAG: hypothetical protein K8T10_15015 [Candidatus Eremiobacteraeota bacterium]|nr:hypothetical protein [Candidatus Eremiobacteraeota bacterium]
MRREIPMAITTITGVIMIVVFFVPMWGHWSDIFLKWFTVIAGFALVLGAGSLLLVNLNKISRKASGWGYNVILILGLFVMAGLGIFQGIKPGTPYDFIFRYIFTPLSATMFSLLAFYIASAAFRAFKAKSPEAALLLITAFVVMIGRVPIGEVMWNWLPWAKALPLTTIIEDWVMGCFNTAGQRAIMLGASIGIISTSLKILLGIERSYLGGGE